MELIAECHIHKPNHVDEERENQSHLRGSTRERTQKTIRKKKEKYFLFSLLKFCTSFDLYSFFAVDFYVDVSILFDPIRGYDHHFDMTGDGER